jgi:hypothetical protein
MTLNYSSHTAGQNPAPMATLTVYNPNAVAVAVTGVTVTGHVLGSTAGSLAMLPSSPPIGPGMTTVAPALSSITIGPFPVVVGTAANINSFQAVNQTGNLNPINPQASQPAPFTVMVGAMVQGSDLSQNVAGEAGLLVSYASAPPLAYQGGFLQLAGPNNLSTAVAAGVA